MISGVTIRIRGFFVFLISVGTVFFFYGTKSETGCGGECKGKVGWIMGFVGRVGFGARRGRVR